MEHLIEIHHITKDYGRQRGVFDLSFQVKKGEVLGFLGPNGAGKTTTIRQLLGFIKPDSGSLRISGMDCFQDADKIQNYLGYLPGETAFIDSMNGMEFIQFVAKMKGMKDLGRAQELMSRFDLNPTGKIKKMSKGMKQKIGIVCAFMQDPEILILDEPTSGLDPLMQEQFVNLILQEKKRGKTILMSSHIFEEVEKTCDRAVIIRNGRLVAVENMETLRSNRKKIMEITFQTSEMASAFASKVLNVACEKNTVILNVGMELDEVIKKAAVYTIMDMNVRTQSLEEFFLHFYHHDMPSNEELFCSLRREEK
ncbi:putative ABC transporter ATP-binding protein YbhF [Clostridiales bacterium CHKCI001]|nr:putative ABC transporter ATP-binding protein YbhF [Clostridiales bacterium CHKCI001]